MKEIKASVDDIHHSFPIALVVSTFNQPITHALKEGALDRLIELGIHQTDITVIEVPGAVEIPYVAQIIAKKRAAKVIIALGAVIRGETTHYDYVCTQASQGCQQVMLEQNIPIIFGVLTTEDEAQAWDRLGGVHGHKGKDAADAALMMRSITTKLEE
jgi:6,7-dimethyl-8-ribityllumazine synthase